MARFGVDPKLNADQAESQLASPAKGFAERAPYRDAIRALEPKQVLRISPTDERDTDGKLVESVRAIQFRILGAAKDLGINVKYGKSSDDSGDILVWLDTSPDAGKPRPKRRKKSDGDETTDESANGTANAALNTREPVAV